MNPIILLIVAALCAMSGCSTGNPLKPGEAKMLSNATNGFASFVKQSENPSQSASQTYEETSTTERPLPARTEIVETTKRRDKSGAIVEQTKLMVLPEPTIEKTVTTRKAGTVVGASQRDTAREIGAVMRGMSGLIYLGAALLLLGVVSLFYPPLKLLVNSRTTSLAVAGVGIALILLPSLVADPRARIMFGIAGISGVVFVFLMVRNAQKQGWIDANKDGIHDHTQNPNKGV